MTTPSDEKMKIPQDLQKHWSQVLASEAQNVPAITIDVCALKHFIERIARTEAQLSASQEQVRRLTEALKKADKCVALGTYPLAIETLSFGRRNAS